MSLAPSMSGYSRRDRRFTVNSGTAAIDSLRAKVDTLLLEQPMNWKAVERANQELADHIRNQHRKRIGAECFTKRWSR